MEFSCAPVAGQYLTARVIRNKIIASVPTRNLDASLLPSSGWHCTEFGQLVTSLKTAMFVLTLCRVSIYRVWSFLGTNKMVQWTEVGCNNTAGKDRSGPLRSPLRSFKYFTLKRPL